MLATVAVTVATHDLARGVLTGVLLSALFFARRVGHLLDVETRQDADGTRRYFVRGQVFFASANAFGDAFDLLEPVQRVVIDVSHAHFWDLSAIGALDTVVMKLRARGVAVEVLGLNAASATLVERLGVHDKPDMSARGLH